MIRIISWMLFSYYMKMFYCIATSVFLILILVSYNHSDPSFNVATNNIPQNWLGYFGSYISDFIYQLFGLSSFLYIAYLILWSYTLYTKKLLNWFIPKALLALLTSLVLSILLSRIDSKLLPSSCGGALGIVFFNHLDVLLSNVSYIGKFHYKTTYILSTILFLSLFALSFKTYIFICFRYIFIKCRAFVGIIKAIFVKLKLKKSFIKKKSLKDKNINDTDHYLLQDTQLPNNVQKQATLPPLDLLDSTNDHKAKLLSHAELEESVKDLLEVLSDFGVKGEILDVKQGPVVTLYEFEPAAGTKSSRVIGLSDDIARSLSAMSTRISVVPGRNVLAIELPNKHRAFFSLKELLSKSNFNDPNIMLPLILGKDLGGQPFIADLAVMPHVLVAGTTGSGKSVAINAMILSLLYRYTAEECKMIMIDPKMLELSVYDNIPHLLTPVVTNPKKAITALKWAVKEMENRYKMMSDLGVRNITNYNNKVVDADKSGEKLVRKIQTGYDEESGRPVYINLEVPTQKMPFIVVIVDEMADLMLVAGKDIETSIQRLAQMARAAGIHIIMATQRPSVDVITGVIKANFPSRISFKVTSKIDSRTILGEQGAEQLLGRGDMLFIGNSSKILRVHAPFVDDKEVERVVKFLSSTGKPDYIAEVTKLSDDNEENSEEDLSIDDKKMSDDMLYKQAIDIVRKDRKISTSYIQRVLRIGYNRAAILVEKMEKDGLVSPPNHSGKREIMIKDD